MPKLLDVIKEKGLTHEQVIKLLDNIQEETSEVELTEEPVEIIQEVEEVIEDVSLPEVDNNPQPELFKVSQEELTKLISDAVEEKLKARRTAPSKGKVVDKTTLQKEPATQTKRQIATKDWFEVIV